MSIRSTYSGSHAVRSIDGSLELLKLTTPELSTVSRVELPFPRVLLCPGTESHNVAWAEDVGSAIKIQSYSHPNLKPVGPVHSFFTPGGMTWLQSIALAPCDSVIAAASFNEAIRIYRLGGELLAEFEGGEFTSGMKFDPLGRWLVAMHTFQGGGYASLYHLQNGTVTCVADELERIAESPIIDLADTFATSVFKSDSKSFIVQATTAERRDTAGWRCELRSYQTPDGKEQWCTQIDADVTGDDRSLKELGTGGTYLGGLSYSKSGNIVFFGSTSGIIVALDSASGQFIGRKQTDLDEVAWIGTTTVEDVVWACCQNSNVVAVKMGLE